MDKVMTDIELKDIASLKIAENQLFNEDADELDEEEINDICLALHRAKRNQPQAEDEVKLLKDCNALLTSPYTEGWTLERRAAQALKDRILAGAAEIPGDNIDERLKPHEVGTLPEAYRIAVEFLLSWHKKGIPDGMDDSLGLVIETFAINLLKSRQPKVLTEDGTLRDFVKMQREEWAKLDDKIGDWTRKDCVYAVLMWSNALRSLEKRLTTGTGEG